MALIETGRDENSLSFGILGAGRLGNALAKRLRSMGAPSPIWSRRYDSHDQVHQFGTRGYEVTPIETVASSNVVLSAIPNQALITLSTGPLKGFSGVMVAMGIDAPAQWVRDALPDAMVIRTSPAVPTQRGGEIRMIGLLDEACSGDLRLGRARSALEALGSIAWIEHEVLYELTTLVAGPLLTLITSAVSRTVETSLEARRLPLEFKERVETIVLSELATRSLDRRECSLGIESERSTPGGVTEIALGHKEDLSIQLGTIVSLMQDRMSQLRNRTET
ncbi:NAD(P)-binding domain-containing protein [Rhizobium mongolense]|uniref:NAD(P)-binding domain-containing protein n=1 Tax=Rhizobium mongolense TaxID=57676 RepID=UPI003558DF15